MVGLCEKEQADLLLIAGDLFHRQPLLRELKEVDHLFRTLSRTQVVLAAGNHDYIRKNSYYRTFAWSENVHMILNSEISCVELADFNLAVYGLSYQAKEMEEPLYERVWIEDDLKYHILLAHGGDEKHLPFRKAVVDGLGFDYVALGHIHKPQELIPGRMAYAGALEPVDKNDTGKHGLIRGNLDGSGCKIQFVPAAQREYIHTAVEVEEDTTGFALREKIRKRIQELGVQNVYKLTLEGLKDPDIRFDLAGMDPFGNVVEIIDHTRPAYDFGKLLGRNRENLMGRFIESFGEAELGSVEYQALCEGVQALLETKRDHT